MRIFLDTNIIISAILFPCGETARFLRTTIEEHSVIISSYVIEELYQVFEAKFADRTNVLETFLMEFGYELVHSPKRVEPTKYPKVRDPKDLPILAAAMGADCDYIVSGDKDLLAVRIERPRVVSPREFMSTNRDVE